MVEVPITNPSGLPAGRATIDDEQFPAVHRPEDGWSLTPGFVQVAPAGWRLRGLVLTPGEAAGEQAAPQVRGRLVDIVFASVEGTPDMTFVETETPEGVGVGVGTWVPDEEHPGWMRLRLLVLDDVGAADEPSPFPLPRAPITGELRCRSCGQVVVDSARERQRARADASAVDSERAEAMRKLRLRLGVDASGVRLSHDEHVLALLVEITTLLMTRFG